MGELVLSHKNIVPFNLFSFTEAVHFCRGLGLFFMETGGCHSVVTLASVNVLQKFVLYPLKFDVFWCTNMQSCFWAVLCGVNSCGDYLKAAFKNYFSKATVFAEL